MYSFMTDCKTFYGQTGRTECPEQRKLLYLFTFVEMKSKPCARNEYIFSDELDQ